MNRLLDWVFELDDMLSCGQGSTVKVSRRAIHG